MEAKDYLDYICRVIHTAVVATVDDAGRPVTAAIDMMDSDGSSLYFLTATGKSFYDRLKNRGELALTALRGEDTMSSVAVSLQGQVRELGPELLPRLFALNPYMNEIYPTAASRSVLTVFQIYAGSGEWFDLRQKPIERAVFSFGGAESAQERYLIGDACTGCGACAAVCPQQCIDGSGVPFRIEQGNCILCGSCRQECPAGAISKV